MKYITRIAPSPTGPVHLGTIRTAYFNWLAARSSGGKFIIRIDDTDLQRSEQKWADKFLTTMSWLGLNWDELHWQSKRTEIYNAHADKLIASNLAKRDGKHVHLDLTVMPEYDHWIDAIGGKINIKKDNLIGFEQATLIKSDGSPTYHFASCVDDIELGTNFIIRGVDHITNTSRHVLLYKLLGAEFPKIAHIGLIRTVNGKLSKRDPESDFQSYIDQGYDPDAILNFVARLCWGPSKDDKTTTILTKDDMIRLFLDGGKMNSKDAMFDIMKLNSFDRKYKGRKNPRFTTNLKEEK